MSDIQRSLAGLERLSRRREEELKKLCQNPELHDVALALMEALLLNLTYLCNFQYLVDGFDKHCDVVEVMERLEDDIIKTYEKLTGHSYKASICRAVDFLKKEQRESN